jgi:polyphosphate kinase
MVRVAGMQRRLSAGLPVRGGDQMPLRTQLQLVSETAADLVARHSHCFVDEVMPKLAAENIGLVHWDDLPAPERQRLRTYFREQIFPVLTPLAVDPAHPFPYISSRSLNLAVVVRDSDAGSELFARVKVPNNVPRFVRVEREAPGSRFLPLEDLIAVHLDQLFSGMQVVECHLFRVTRNAEVEVDEDRDEDLLQALERELARRRFGPRYASRWPRQSPTTYSTCWFGNSTWTARTCCGCRGCSTCRRCGRSTTSATGPI